MAERRDAAPPDALRAALLGLGLLVAFSPVWVDLVAHWVAEPWSRYSIAFVPLLGLAARRDAGPRRAAWDGWLLLAVALAVEIFFVAGELTRMARPALALGLLGLARASGLVSWPVALLGAWLVPVPSLVVELTSPGLESLWLAWGGSLAAALGAPVVQEGALLARPDAQLALAAPDGGLPLAGLLSGLGWYASLRRGFALPGALARAAAGAAAGLALQGAVAVPWVAAWGLGAPLDAAHLSPALAALCFAIGWPMLEVRAARGHGGGAS